MSAPALTPAAVVGSRRCFGLAALSAPFGLSARHKMRTFGFISIFFEDIPQICIVCSSNAIKGSWSAISTASVVLSAVTVFGGVVKRNLELMLFRHSSHLERGSSVLTEIDLAAMGASLEQQVQKEEEG